MVPPDYHSTVDDRSDVGGIDDMAKLDEQFETQLELTEVMANIVSGSEDITPSALTGDEIDCKMQVSACAGMAIDSVKQINEVLAEAYRDYEDLPQISFIPWRNIKCNDVSLSTLLNVRRTLCLKSWKSRSSGILFTISRFNIVSCAGEECDGARKGCA